MYDSSNTDVKTGKPLKKYAPARVPPMDKPSTNKPTVSKVTPTKVGKAGPRPLTNKEKLKQKQNTLPANTRRALEKEGVL